MYAVASSSGKKTWQTRRERVSVEAALAIQRENVMQRLIRLREEIGHPDKDGEPLPQDQAAARAGVTARQWQRWESGESVPYARNLSAVADAFGFDVGEFYDGPAGQRPAGTPDLSLVKPDALADRLDELRRQVTDQLAEHARKVEDYLERQDAVLKRIEDNIAAEKAAKVEAEAARAATDAARTRLLEAAEVASRVYEDAVRRLEEARDKRAT